VPAHAGLQQASAEAALQLVQRSLVACQVLRRALQSVREPVQLLAALVEILLDLAAQGKPTGGEAGEQRGLFGCRQLGGSGGGWRALISSEIGNGEVCFMTDTADHRQRTGTYRPRHGLVVESPEIFDAATTPTYDQQFAFPTLAGAANGCGDLRGCAITLYLRRVDDDADLAGTASERAQHVVQRRRLQ
jgi:hypothetical protein